MCKDGGRWPQRLKQRLREDRGAGSLELSILTPVIFLIIWGSIQGMLYAHGRNVAQAAAERGVEVGRSYDAADRDGPAAARAFLDHMGDAALRSRSVSGGASSADQVEITVTGRVPSLVPGMRWDIEQTARGPREQLP